MAPIRTMDDLRERVERYGFLPMFRNSIKGFSIYEHSEGFWSEEDGPWEWKGPMIREGYGAYGKFFQRKAGYVSIDVLPDFLNWRRSLSLAPTEDLAALDDVVLQTIATEGRVTIADLKRLFGVGKRKRRSEDLVDEGEPLKLNLEGNLTRLMMGGRITCADFTYNRDRQGNDYGWGIAVYSTPENLYGSGISAVCEPMESKVRLMKRLSKSVPSATGKQLEKFLL